MRADEFLPDDQDEGRFKGISVRKGSVGAFIFNVRVILDAASAPAEKAAAFKDIEAVIPGLDALGLFEVMEVRDEGIREFVHMQLQPNT